MKKTLVVSFVFAASVSFAATNLTGKVNFKGKAPKVEAIKMNADPQCVKASAGKPVNKEEISVNANNTLKNVFVYVKEGLKKEAIPAPNLTPVTLDQKGCMYTPHVVGVLVNQPIKISNSDTTMHNVHALPKANTTFNSVTTAGQALEKKFAKPELMVRMKCDVHGWMNAYIGVMEHPFFAVSDANGAFTISNLPAGDYTVEAWHEKLGTQTAKVSVKEGAATVDFTFGDKAVN